MTGTCLLGADVIVLMARRQAVTSILSSVVLGLSRFFLPTRILQFCRAHKPPSLPSFQFLPSAAAAQRLPFFFFPIRLNYLIFQHIHFICVTLRRLFNLLACARGFVCVCVCPDPPKKKYNYPQCFQANTETRGPLKDNVPSGVFL